ncbi:hypothetical protein Droror1_Dr00026891 [Drosera rotundifolia]
MDFQSMKRRELQALCKRNKIPANMTNLVMANALQALPIQEPGSSKSPCRGSSKRIAGGETGQEKKDVSSKTEVVAPGSVTKEKGVEMRVYSSRWSTTLLKRMMKELSLDEKAVL